MKVRDTVTDAKSKATSFTYDAMNQPVSQSYSGTGGDIILELKGVRVKLTWSAIWSRTVNATAMQTDYQHNALNHRLTVTESGVAASSCGYDNQDNISRMTDALLKVIRKT
ncbi:MAG: hypothetical protein Q7W05_07425 [Deltaproteobacteria bacterium]|nr:hypothetical protein [Deltaproteobacteria bacterium]